MCHPVCDSDNCMGPTNRDCIQCNKNSYVDGSGACVCIDNWIGPDCSIFNSTCHDICDINAGCSGMGPDDCEECNENAVLDPVIGVCTCLPNWTGDGCDEYLGDCHKLCVDCYGPNPDECIHCTKNSYWSQNQRCECLPGWEGEE
jgi:hypothetical protein